MYRKMGLYVFPKGKMLKQFFYDGKSGKEYPSKSYAEQLIGFLEINLSNYNQIVRRLKNTSFYENGAFSYKIASSVMNTLGVVAASFCDGCPYACLLVTELADRCEGYEFWTIEDFEFYRAQYIEVLENLSLMQDMLSNLMYSYCNTDGTHEEKIQSMSTGQGRIYAHVFQEVISLTKPSVKMFAGTFYEFPITKGYRFDTLPNYLWFLFVNTLCTDVNFSVCTYCGHFFLPMTKRKTRYCDRVRTEDGRTCKQVGPPFIRKLKASNSIVLAEYERARNRNFKRVERTENRLSDKEAGKSLDYETYSNWMERVHAALELWKEEKLSDWETLLVIRELD